MALANFNNKRRLLPRWRKSKISIELGETASVQKKSLMPLTDSDRFVSKVSNWKENKTIEAAVDLVSSALIIDHQEDPIDAIDAAEYLILKQTPSTEVVKNIANSFLGNPIGNNADINTVDTREEIRELRSGLIESPRNALKWVDLSRAYITQGLDKKAERAMDIAYRLNPDNRFVLRSASRLLVHIGKPDKAHYILTKSQSSKFDPWIMSAEISVADIVGITSKSLKKAKQIIKSKSYSNLFTSELSSALGTILINNGDVKNSKKMFKESVIQPTDNSVAQIEWASQQLGNLGIHSENFDIPYLFEADALRNRFDDNWSDVINSCKQWLMDEPYSTRPAILGSYVAAVVQEDYEMCEKFSKEGLRSNPNDLILLNNQVVASINMNKLILAEQYLDQILYRSLPEIYEPMILATHGLLLFRKKLINEGREKYNEAIESATKLKSIDTVALAVLHLTKEEIMAKSDNVNHMLKVSKAACKNINEPEINFMLNSVLNLGKKILK